MVSVKRDFNNSSSIGQTGRPCPVKCRFMDVRENAVQGWEFKVKVTLAVSSYTGTRRYMLKYIVLFQLLCGNRRNSNATTSALLCGIYCSILEHLKVEQSPSCESNSCSGIPKIPCILWNPEVPYHADTSPQLVPILSPLSLILFLFNIILKCMITSSKRYNMHTRYNLLVDFY